MIDGNLKGIMNISLDKPFFNSGINKNEPSNSKTLNTKSDDFEGLQNVADQFEAIFLETYSGKHEKVNLAKVFLILRLTITLSKCLIRN